LKVSYITFLINNFFTYNTKKYYMQEKCCKKISKLLQSILMKVAVNIRMPEGMKKALDRIATNQFRSLNSLILQLLDDQLKARDINWKKKKAND